MPIYFSNKTYIEPGGNNTQLQGDPEAPIIIFGNNTTVHGIGRNDVVDNIVLGSTGTADTDREQLRLAKKGLITPSKTVYVVFDVFNNSSDATLHIYKAGSTEILYSLEHVSGTTLIIFQMPKTNLVFAVDGVPDLGVQFDYTLDFDTGSPPQWKRFPISNEFNDPDNWSGASVPGEFGFAAFANSSVTSIVISDQTPIGGWVFTKDAANYTFTIPDSDDHFLNFRGQGINITGGSATIINNGTNQTVDHPSGLFFGTSATAGTAKIINHGFTGFYESSKAGSAKITNDGTLNFYAAATAGKASLINSAGGGTHFFETSTAGNATVTNNSGGTIQFLETSTAGSAHLVNNSTNNGVDAFGLQFLNGSHAGSATITNAGSVQFFDTSTADNATITTNSGLVLFLGNSDGINGRFITNLGGTVDFSTSTGTANNNAVSAGSISGAGEYKLGGNRLTVGSNNLSTTVSGAIEDGGLGGGTGASLVKVGTGKLKLSHVDNDFSGGTFLQAGTLDVAKVGAAGIGVITFDTGHQTLKIEKAALTLKVFATEIHNFGFGDVIDLAGLKFVRHAKATYDETTHTLTVKSGKVVDTLTLFDPDSMSFKAIDDKHGGTKVILKPLAAKAVGEAEMTAAADDSFRFTSLAEIARHNDWHHDRHQEIDVLARHAGGGEDHGAAHDFHDISLGLGRVDFLTESHNAAFHDFI